MYATDRSGTSRLPRRHYVIATINARQGERPHVVFSETTNLVFTGADGGKSRIKYRVPVSDGDGDIKTIT